MSILSAIFSQVLVSSLALTPFSVDFPTSKLGESSGGLVVTTTVESLEQTYVVAPEKLELDLNEDLERELGLDEDQSSVVARYQMTTISSYGVFKQEWTQNEQSKSHQKDFSGENVPAPGFKTVPGKSLVVLVKRKVEDDDGETKFLPMLVFDTQRQEPYFNPEKVKTELKMEDFDFALDVRFVKGDWDSFLEGKKIRLRATPKGMKELKRVLSEETLNRFNNNARSIIASRVGEGVGETELEYYRFDYDKDDEEEGFFFDGNKDGLESSYPPYENSLSLEWETTR